MQRLSENAMWLREDNLSAKNEIVIPYDSELALWDRPSWIDSLLRLRWCCPPPPTPSKDLPITLSWDDDPTRPRSGDDEKENRMFDYETPAAKSKKNGREKRIRKHKQPKAVTQGGLSGSFVYQHPRHDVPPPPPPTPEQLYHRQPSHYNYPQYQNQIYGNSTFDHNNYGHQYSYSTIYHYQEQTSLGYSQYLPQTKQQYTPASLYAQHYYHHVQNHNGYIYGNSAEYQRSVPCCYPMDVNLAFSSLSSVDTGHLAAIVTPETNDKTAQPSQQAENENEYQQQVDITDALSPIAAAAGNAAANLASEADVNLTERNGGDKQQQRLKQQQQRAGPGKNSKAHKLPALVTRNTAVPQPGIPQQHDATVTPSSCMGGEKPPLLPQRPRSLSPSGARTSPPIIQIPSSPFSDRPRLHSDGSRRSVCTGSTRHRRMAHEKFEFDVNSLQEIAKEDQNLPRTSPPKYIECPRRSSVISEWSALEKLQEEDDQSNSSIDDEIKNLVLRTKTQSNHAEFISPTYSSDDNPGLQVRNPNLPPISWLNSWSAQGDDAAGNPPTKESKLKEGRALRKRRGKEKNTGYSQVKQTGRHKELSSIHVDRPVYLPRCKLFDRPIRKAKNRVVVSGWAAISLSDKLRNRLAVMEGPLQLVQADIAYFQLIEFSDRSRRPILRIKQESKDLDYELGDRYSHRFQSLDVCGRAGRCICLSDSIVNKVLVTILPVSLPRKYFFCDDRFDRVVDESLFLTYRMALFTPFTTVPPRPISTEHPDRFPEHYVNRYAPDEQYDAATHILCASDSLFNTVC